MSMQCALQFFSQRRQDTHLPPSIVMRKSENRDSRLSPVPTGQTVLQYSRPHIAA